MNEISILQFRKNIYACLDSLPLKVTAKGKTVFYVVKDVSTHNVSTVNKVSTHTGEKIKKIVNVEKKKPLFCPKHGASRIGGNYTCGCNV